MIGRLQGVVVSESPDGTVVVDVRGVGYEVVVPLGSLGRCPRTADGAVTLHVHTNVREDAITLFGFSSETERATFRLLTSVAGVGPRTAVAVLGVLPTSELASAIARADVKRLQSVPGVGKRLAERLALELKDKLVGGAHGASNGAASHAAPSAPLGPLPGVPAGPTGQLVAALTHMGFKPAEAERVAMELAPRAGEGLDVMVREALKRLVP